MLGSSGPPSVPVALPTVVLPAVVLRSRCRGGQLERPISSSVRSTIRGPGFSVERGFHELRTQESTRICVGQPSGGSCPEGGAEVPLGPVWLRLSLTNEAGRWLTWWRWTRSAVTLTLADRVRSEPTSALLARRRLGERGVGWWTQSRAGKGDIYQRERGCSSRSISCIGGSWGPPAGAQGVRPCPWLFASHRALGPRRDSSGEGGR